MGMMRAFMLDERGLVVELPPVKVRARALDAWENEAREGDCCITRPGGSRGTYHLCGSKATGLLVSKDGTARPACTRHIAAAKRRRSFGYAEDAVAVMDLDGAQTHVVEKTSYVHGYFRVLAEGEGLVA